MPSSQQQKKKKTAPAEAERHYDIDLTTTVDSSSDDDEEEQEQFLQLVLPTARTKKNDRRRQNRGGGGGGRNHNNNRKDDGSAAGASTTAASRSSAAAAAATRKEKRSTTTDGGGTTTAAAQLKQPPKQQQQQQLGTAANNKNNNNYNNGGGGGGKKKSATTKQSEYITIDDDDDDDSSLSSSSSSPPSRGGVEGGGARRGQQQLVTKKNNNNNNNHEGNGNGKALSVPRLPVGKENNSNRNAVVRRSNCKLPPPNNNNKKSDDVEDEIRFGVYEKNGVRYFFVMIMGRKFYYCEYYAPRKSDRLLVKEELLSRRGSSTIWYHVVNGKEIVAFTPHTNKYGVEVTKWDVLDNKSGQIVKHWSELAPDTSNKLTETEFWYKTDENGKKTLCGKYFHINKKGDTKLVRSYNPPEMDRSKVDVMTGKPLRWPEGTVQHNIYRNATGQGGPCPTYILVIDGENCYGKSQAELYLTFHENRNNNKEEAMRLYKEAKRTKRAAAVGTSSKQKEKGAVKNGDVSESKKKSAAAENLPKKDEGDDDGEDDEQIVVLDQPRDVAAKDASKGKAEDFCDRLLAESKTTKHTVIVASVAEHISQTQLRADTLQASTTLGQQGGIVLISDKGTLSLDMPRVVNQLCMLRNNGLDQNLVHDAISFITDLHSQIQRLEAEEERLAADAPAR